MPPRDEIVIESVINSQPALAEVPAITKKPSQMFLNNEDLKRVAAILASLHNISIEEAWMHPEKWLNYEGNELTLVPVLKPTKISKESK